MLGVGPKTADILLLMIAKESTIPVDTHVMRAASRLYRWSVKTIIGTLIDKGFEHEVRVITVNEAYTSSTCPICGSRLNKNSSPMTHYVVRIGVMNALKVKVLKFEFRFLECPKCEFKHDRDVIAVLNMFKRIRKWVLSTLGTTAQTLIWGCGNPLHNQNTNNYQ